MGGHSGLADVGFFESGQLRNGALVSNHLKAFETHGVVGAIVITAARKARLKRVVHGASVLGNQE